MFGGSLGPLKWGVLRAVFDSFTAINASLESALKRQFYDRLRATTRRVMTATTPHVVHITNSQIAIESDEAPGIQVLTVHQGTRAPIAKACTSPRAKIAQINSGVGNTQ